MRDRPNRPGGRRPAASVSGVYRLVLAALAVLLAACAPAASTPAPPPAPTSAATSAPPTALVPLPPRPYEIRLDGVDPCTLLAPEELTDLGLEQRATRDVRTSRLYGGVTDLCSWSGFEPRAIAVGVNLSVTGGVELFTERPVPGVVTPLDVQGFPAVLARSDRFPEACSVIIDAAPQQAVDVQFRDGGRLPRNPQDELCEGAQAVADLVMAHLIAR